MNAIFAADIFLVATAFVYLAIASYTDIKKREVPDWLSFSLIAIALFTRLIASIITGNFSYILTGLVVFAIFFVLANIFYMARLFGGGDAKLLMGLAACLATAPFFASNVMSEPFPLALLINILLIGAIYGIFFSIGAAIKNRQEFKQNWKEIKKNKFTSTRFILFFILTAIAFALIFILHEKFFILLTILLAVIPFIIPLVKAVENITVKKMSPHDIYEGDILIEKSKRKVLTKKDVLLLKKANRPVTIFYGAPFVPVFLLATLATLLFGDILVRIILALI